MPLPGSDLRSIVPALAVGFLLVAGCATSELPPDTTIVLLPDAEEADADPFAPDAGPPPDARVIDAPTPPPDAYVPPPPDAYVPPPPDAYVPPPDAPPCTHQWQTLLTNSNFDSGHVGWSESPANAIIRTVPSAFGPAHSGTWAAQLCGLVNEDDVLSQSVTLPSTTTNVRLRAWKCFDTDDVSSSRVDYVTVTLRQGGATVLTLVNDTTWTNLTSPASCSWNEYVGDSFGAASWAGETVSLVIEGISNASGYTSFWLDDVDLEVYACP